MPDGPIKFSSNAAYVAFVILSAPLLVVVSDKLFPIPVNPYTSRLANPVKFEPSIAGNEPVNCAAGMLVKFAPEPEKMLL